MSVGRHRGRHGIDPEWREIAAACGHGEVGGLFQAAREGEGRIGRPIAPPAEKIDDHRFAGCGGLLKDSRRDGGRRRLGDQRDNVRIRIGGEQVEGLQHGHAADTLIEIPAAGADRLGDAAAPPVDLAGHFLGAGAGCADDADTAPANPVGEAQRHTVDDGGAAVGPHHQETVIGGE